jgi:hypothetical protein
MKMEIFRSLKGILLTFALVFGLLFVMGFVMTIVFDADLSVYSHAGTFAFSLMAGGFILSSLAFNDLSHTLKRYRYLTLPASGFEKFLSMWLLTSLGWVLAFTLAYFIYAVFVNALGSVIFRSISFMPFDPFGHISVQAAKYYFVLQGIFLAGATTFKGYVFPKTMLSLVLFALVCGLVFYLAMHGMFKLDEDYFLKGNTLVKMPVYRFWQLAVWFFWWVLAPLSWVIGYMGLKEKEV